MSQPLAGITEQEFAKLFLEPEDFNGTIKMIQDSSMSGPDPGDLPFSKNQGLFAGFRVWLDEAENAVWRVVDIRFALPGEEKASQYHHARLKANSEGHPPVENAIRVGKDCHVFGGSSPNPFSADMNMVVYYYVFQVHNIVVKLFVAEGPEVKTNKLDVPTVASIAKKIESRINAQSY